MFMQKHFRLLCIVITFLALLFVGLLSYRDYGITWDEKAQYAIGSLAYNFLTQGTPWTDVGDWRFFGTTFELILSASEHFLGISDDAQAVFFLRHFMTFLSYFTGVVFLYLLAKRHFQNWKWALLACLFFVLSPRIFGNAFYNSKDIPALSAFIIAMYTLVRLHDQQSWRSMALHAFACAIVVTIRMTGIVLIPFTALLLLLDATDRGFAAATARWFMFRFGFFLVVWWFITIALWPFLWESPIRNFADAYFYMSAKPFGGFYFGEDVHTPVWHWIPVWIFITTPVLYSALFLCGCARRLWSLATDPQSFFRDERITLFFLLWFFVPILAVILLRAGIYDDWRHVYFIYPAFILIAVDGARFIADRLSSFRSATRKGFFLLVAISCGSTMFWMIRNHPYESVYFSLPSSYIEGSFELDYWGLSSRDAFEYILENDSSELLSVYSTASSGWSVPNMLTTEQRKRLIITKDIDQAKYIVDNFRGTGYVKTFADAEKIYSITVSGIEIAAVYKNPIWNEGVLKPSNLLPTTGVLLMF